METARDVLTALARRYAFGDLAALIAQGTVVPDHHADAVAALCAFGQRVLDLDAEDFGMPEDAGEVPTTCSPGRCVSPRSRRPAGAPTSTAGTARSPPPSATSPTAPW